MFEAGKVASPRPIPTHLPTLLSDVVEAVRSVEQLGGRQVNVAVNSAGVPTGVLADPMLRRVLFNLVSNAMRFCSDNGNVEIKVSYCSGTDPLVEDSSEDDEQASKRSRLFRSFEGFRFLIKNTTSKPLDVNDVNIYFQSYYHNDSSLVVASKAGVDAGAETSKEFSEELQSSRGLGLGLHVAYNMVQLMGGLLECGSTATESRFWFTVRLPLVDTLPPHQPQHNMFNIVPAGSPSFSSRSSTCDIWDTSAAAMHLAPPQSPKRTLTSSSSVATDVTAISAGPDTNISIIKTPDGAEKRMRVLVVDDSSICQKMIIKALEKYDFATDVASNGRTRYCREVLELRSLPIIALTAEVGSDARDAALGAGANELVGKPAQTKQLVETLRRCYEAQF
jgi:CheY-like chemotaxis protein